MFENRGQAFVTAVRLLVPATGAFVSCGNIPPGGTCATTFPEVKYTGNEMEVTWSQGGQIFSTGQLRLSPSNEVLEAGAARVRVVIAGPGVAGAQLVPAPAAGQR